MLFALLMQYSTLGHPEVLLLLTSYLFHSAYLLYDFICFNINFTLLISKYLCSAYFLSVLLCLPAICFASVANSR